jgi:serine protease Do
MYRKLLLTLGAAAAVALPSIASAQAEARTFRVEPGGGGFAYSFGEENSDRAVIGITTSTGSRRDTLGVLVSSITAGSPAEKAGLEEGNRIASINGVNLKLAPADIDDWDMSSIMSRRLTRELGKLKAGDDVELRVYGGGQVRTVKVKTVAYDSLYRSQRRVRFDDEDRAVLGVSLGSSGSKRDTLGVLVTWLNDEGPAAKSGLEEGNRIAAINGVDLRVSRDDAGDEMISGVKVQRLQRELTKVKPGDEVELRVYGDGKTRTVKIKTVAASKLNRGRGSILMDGFPRMVMPAVPPMPPMAAPMGPRVRVTRISI